MKSEIRFESKLHAGVFVTIRRVGLRKRLEINQSIAQSHAKYLDLAVEKNAIQVEGNAITRTYPKDPATGEHVVDVLTEQGLAVAKRLAAKQSEMDDVQSEELLPAWLKATLIKIEGGGMDECTAEDLLDTGPANLAEEIAVKAQAAVNLTQQEAENLFSRSTSGAQAERSNSIAMSASAGETSQQEIASSTKSTPNGQGHESAT